jgi:sporulation protein YlmC with PRC-barrel domain
MLELIIIGFIFWLGYQVGMNVTAYRLRYLVYKEAKRRGLVKEIDLDLEEEPTVVQLFVEKANNTLYLYDKCDNTFVCQGSTLEELARLAKKYKNIDYAAVMIDKEIYAFVDGTVKSEQEVLR